MIPIGMILYKIISLQIDMLAYVHSPVSSSCQREGECDNILGMNRAVYAFFYFFAFPTPLVEEGKRRTH